MKAKPKQQYKFLIAIAFGLLGFIINLGSYSIFEFNNITINLLPGLLFPLLITLSWGWKYGLLSALFGGCQSLWFNSTNQGYEVLYSVLILIFWIIFHGFLAEKSSKVAAEKWYYNKFVGEIVFRTLASIAYFLIFKWLIEINSNYVSQKWLQIALIKNMFEGYFLLLLAEIILRTDFFKRILLLDTKVLDLTILYATFGGVFAWVIDTLVLTFLDQDFGSGFLGNLIFDVHIHDLVMRIIMIYIFIIVGIIYSNNLKKIEHGKKLLSKQYDGIKGILSLAKDIGEAPTTSQEAFLINLLNTAMKIIPESDFGVAYLINGDYLYPIKSNGHTQFDLTNIKFNYKLIFDENNTNGVFLIENYIDKLLEISSQKI